MSDEKLSRLIDVPALTRRLYAAPLPMDLEPRALQVLVAVVALGSPTVHDLVDHLALASQTVSALLNKLAVKNLVVRRPDPGDQRQQLQTATETGRAVVAQFADSTSWLLAPESVG